MQKARRNRRAFCMGNAASVCTDVDNCRHTVDNYRRLWISRRNSWGQYVNNIAEELCRTSAAPIMCIALHELSAPPNWSPARSAATSPPIHTPYGYPCLSYHIYGDKGNQPGVLTGRLDCRMSSFRATEQRQDAHTPCKLRASRCSRRETSESCRGQRSVVDSVQRRNGHRSLDPPRSRRFV
jgi:hypothetical protein